MSYVVINPGTGPAEGASESDALTNALAFAAELGESVTVQRCADDDGNYVQRGRFAFRLSHGDRSVLIHMPGLPSEHVQYTGADGQNIWHFPRLYVDGSSWVWCFGLGIAEDRLFGDEEGDE